MVLAQLYVALERVPTCSKCNPGLACRRPHQCVQHFFEYDINLLDMAHLPDIVHLLDMAHIPGRCSHDHGSTNYQWYVASPTLQIGNGRYNGSSQG